ncbi:MAG: TetR family transcriptional regulator [Geobacteraceae bacterium GWC2_55_20]|nr:TetR/AcrR family transcriptional regulator [Deltaproteobacteria bacterium]OGU07220.1 MAG: TetR family transcriptional regulator [Geobacteraceae bacterium GWC2_55_20]OGU21691.1 MAG: TetR family transcriptional regulator [Geobacteraceae bacterium GWF2_54_21]HCE69160.1 TetR family transcriptional regulator [Geobacter sp.]
MAKPDKRDEIVRAALELIAENGFHGAPMAMIADKAGVGAGTIYRYFENKDVLINELYRELEQRLLTVLMDGYSPDKSVRERFIHLGTAVLRYCISNPLDFRYLEQFHNSPYGVVHRRDKISGEADDKDIYRKLFEEGLSRQVIKDLPLVMLFSLAFGPLISVARDHILGFVSLDDDLIVKIIAACWDGLKR